MDWMTGQRQSCAACVRVWRRSCLPLVLALSVGDEDGVEDDDDVDATAHLDTRDATPKQRAVADVLGPAALRFVCFDVERVSACILLANVPTDLPTRSPPANDQKLRAEVVVFGC